MRPPGTGRTAFKKKIAHILETEPPDAMPDKLGRFPDAKVINTLFSLLYDLDPKIKWGAVTLMGSMVAKIADEDMESARIIMRRLMWNLNDESGGIGWGSPEAMGEILSRHKALADEYASILVSYARKDGNFLEHEALQQGLLWGIGRLAGVCPQLIEDHAGHLIPYLESPDPAVRGLATWVLGRIEIEEKEFNLNLDRLLRDHSEIRIYMDSAMKTFTIRDLAAGVSGKNRESATSSPSDPGGLIGKQPL